MPRRDSVGLQYTVTPWVFRLESLWLSFIFLSFPRRGQQNHDSKTLIWKNGHVGKKQTGLSSLSSAVAWGFIALELCLHFQIVWEVTTPKWLCKLLKATYPQRGY